MKISERFEGCIICGSIGDAYGSAHENLTKTDSNDSNTFYLFGKPKKVIPKWKITDDTQLTLATCEEIIENNELKPEDFAQKYLDYFKQRKITGIGASTLKALQELEVGGHWSQVDRKGEYTAGNGAYVRIYSLAFVHNMTREQIREISIITHNNDEAYIGALSIVFAIRAILNGEWTGKENLIELLIDQIPDTRLRDRLIEIKNINNLLEIGQKGNDGYVVNSVPLAIAAANKVTEIGIDGVFEQLIEIGGDTDTNASIAGQIAGTLIGRKGIPENLMSKLTELNEFDWIEKTINNYNNKKTGCNTV
ncbi:MAG: ADP-ribosylglycohydrolase family protein [Flavobacteriaceae bacterium]|nr:ADP-ribosylglycohydrolase family protein [Flavobacteriaceae bacterium]